MRNSTLLLLIIIVLALGWSYYCAQPAYLKLETDAGSLYGTLTAGKPDSKLAATVLGDIGTIAHDSVFGTVHDVSAHAVSVPAGKPRVSPPDHAVVIIKGDEEQGTGFFVRMPDGPVVFTNYHVIAANPHFRVLADDGSEIKVTSIRGASDRDIAILGIEAGNYQYLTLEPDVAHAVSAGTAVMTPGNSEGGGVTLDTAGKVKGVGPMQVEISNPVFHGNSGGPVVDDASGRVVGVVTYVMTRKPRDQFDQASRNTAGSAISSDVRYFAMRIDTVPQWDTYDMDKVEQQSEFLQKFADDTRCLDSYLNGTRYIREDEIPADPEYYKRNPVLNKLPGVQTFFTRTLTDAGPELINALDDCMRFAQGGLNAVQNSHNFYAFQWRDAQEAALDRSRLIKEIQAVTDKLNDKLNNSTGLSPAMPGHL